ncbi:unnamed protein product [Phyllotreta striolata]|uniref:Uncharacterized protein n=1 Tax=Phyllotreta striolata TaxID=444603 RepID=A0A9N9TT66_PHYSR|nr:unnamed protein product [Phyllotreta striolata]
MKNFQFSHIFAAILASLILYTQAQLDNSKQENYGFTEQNITINSTSKWELDLDVTRLSHADEYTNYSLYYNVWASFHMDGLRGLKSFNVANLFSYNIMGGHQTSENDAISNTWSLGDVNVTLELSVSSEILSDKYFPYNYPVIVRWFIQRQVNVTYPHGAKIGPEEHSLGFVGTNSDPKAPGLFNLFRHTGSDVINVHARTLDVSPNSTVTNSHVTDGFNVTNNARITPSASVSLQTINGIDHYQLDELTVVESIITLFKV